MIWLVGNRGMLGRDVAGKLESAGIEYVGTDKETDITKAEIVADFATRHHPEVIINCAAYTNVDRAEDEEEIAGILNADAPGNLARAAAESGSRLIHVSTDYVFEGNADRPLSEDEPTGPVGAYGRTKLDGELSIAESGCSYDIVRTAWLYGLHGPNFITTMIRLMNEKDEIKVVNDQIGSPTWAEDLADFLVFLAGKTERASRIYHFSGEGRISWYDFAAAIQEEAKLRRLVGKDIAIKPCSSDEYQTRATRPAFSLLSKERIRTEFDWNVPEWKTSLRRYLDILGESHE